MACIFALLAVLPLALMALPAMAAPQQRPLDLIFANVSSAPFAIQSVTIDGTACASCGAQTLAPGATAMISVGAIDGKHLKVVMASAGAVQTFQTNGSSSSIGGGNGGKTDITFQSIDGSMVFRGDSSPTFELLYAYDKDK
ncbi:MAG: hypothetical protein WBQ17_11240 [Rhizomicrobium sp.]|jgi:hypothetical protein